MFNLTKLKGFQALGKAGSMILLSFSLTCMNDQSYPNEQGVHRQDNEKLQTDMVLMLCLQWFSTGAIIPPRGHLATSEDMIGNHKKEEGATRTACWIETRFAAKDPILHRMA